MTFCSNATTPRRRPAGDPAPEPAGEFFKAQGVFDEPTGPYGRGDGTGSRRW